VILHKGLTNLSISTFFFFFFYHIAPRIYMAGRMDWMGWIDGWLEARGVASGARNSDKNFPCVLFTFNFSFIGVWL